MQFTHGRGEQALSFATTSSRSSEHLVRPSDQSFLIEFLGGPRIVKSVTRALGIICGRARIHCTSLTGPEAMIEEDTVISTPTSLTDRGAELNLLLEEAVELLRRLRPDLLYVKKSPGGQRQSAREQHEVEAIVQVAAHRAGVACSIRTTEQVRAAHVPRGKGAYKQLLERKDVKARGSKSRREGYLYAATALGEQPEG